jgi:hypothetical protein
MNPASVGRLLGIKRKLEDLKILSGKREEKHFFSRFHQQELKIVILLLSVRI